MHKVFHLFVEYLSVGVMKVSILISFRSEEPEEKKAHTEDTTSSSTQMIDGDLQANQAAYNYSAWYQVSLLNYHGIFFIDVIMKTQISFFFKEKTCFFSKLSNTLSFVVVLEFSSEHKTIFLNTPALIIFLYMEFSQF